jgi:hypothetical protein
VKGFLEPGSAILQSFQFSVKPFFGDLDSAGYTILQPLKGKEHATASAMTDELHQ